MPLKLSSPDFDADGPIPVKHTGLGPDSSPRLEWTRPPARTRTFALVCEDPATPAGTWIHWVVFDIPPHLDGLPAGLSRTETVLGGAKQGRNSFGRLGWGGPCPPPGKEHKYVFRLYAVSKVLGLSPGATAGEVARAMEGWVLSRADLAGTFILARSA